MTKCNQHPNCPAYIVNKKGDVIHTREQAERYANYHLIEFIRIVKHFNLDIEVE